jgi:hypothetical protein
MPCAAKKITNHVRNGFIGVRQCSQAASPRLDREAEVGQRDVGLQQGHGTGLGGKLCRSG